RAREKDDQRLSALCQTFLYVANSGDNSTIRIDTWKGPKENFSHPITFMYMILLLIFRYIFILGK
ncbi:MAG TPA: hypothetical protein VN922_03365, partial [Bacteroidia bacterium]|nr:hypothetical protein [Bacteroidia bacterium]